MSDDLDQGRIINKNRDYMKSDFHAKILRLKDLMTPSNW